MKTTTSKPYLDNLTALRGIAALLVVVFHAHEVVAKLHPPELTHLTRSLYLMVDLFFILSGFVMCYVYAENFSSRVTGGVYREFLSARFARLYPLHLFTLLVLGLCEVLLFTTGKSAGRPPFMDYMMSPAAFVGNLLLLQSVGVFQFITWNVPSWSISAEWWVYLVFPFLVPLVWKSGVRAGMVLVLAALGLWLGIEHGLSYHVVPIIPDFPSRGGSLDVVWKFGALRGLAGFLAGMAVWRFWSLGVLNSVFTGGWVLLACTLGWMLGAHFHAPDTVVVCTFALIIWVAANGGGRVDRIFQWTPLQRLGDWSYSVYMWHMVFFGVLTSVAALLSSGPPQEGPPPAAPYPVAWAICITWMALSVLVGWLSYKYLETPFRKRLRRWLMPAEKTNPH